MCPCILSAPGYCILMLLSTQSVLFDMSQPATHIRKKKTTEKCRKNRTISIPPMDQPPQLSMFRSAKEEFAHGVA